MTNIDRTMKQIEEVVGADINGQTRATVVPLGESAQEIFKNSIRDINLIFDHAMTRIKAVRHACDEAEEAVSQRRKDVEAGLHNYVAALQVVAQTTETMQRAIGDVLLSSDRLGGAN